MWKLYTVNQNSRPLPEGRDPPLEVEEFDSRQEALQRACDYIRHQIHIKVDRIEGPGTNRMDYQAIKAVCDAQPKAP
jgi:hypothetical protein